MVDENTYVLSGSLAVYEVEKLLDIEIPEGNYDTISGYLIEQLGRIPGNKEKPLIETPTAVYKIEKVKDQRIIKIRATKIQVLSEEDEEELDDEE